MGARRFALALSAFAAMMLVIPSVAAATTYVVARADDSDGTCPSADNCSLRQAINSANASPGSDRIEFDIPPGGPQKIQPVVQALPTIVDPVTIDATTQPGYAGAPIIEVNGDLVVVPQNAFAPGLSLATSFSTVEGLLIDGFKFGGAIHVFGGRDNIVQANYLGMVPASAATSKNDVGVWVDSGALNTQIGGPNPRDRNVISGNVGREIELSTGPGTVIEGNYIGTDPTGTGGPPNPNGVGILVNVGSDGVTIGGALAGQANVIANELNGVWDFADGTTIQGNFIGTDVTGTHPLGNTVGIQEHGSHALIGGSSGGVRNIISGNTVSGIRISVAAGPGSDNVIQGNSIGVGADGEPLPNAVSGIQIAGGATRNLVGGLGQADGNVIAYNGGPGVLVDTGAGIGNGILSNHIHDNGALGIDLAPLGPNPNDPGDGDTGPNDLQNYPTLTRVDSTAVQGVLNSHPNTTYTIQVFGNLACDPSGFGEGQDLTAQLQVTTDATGTATFMVGVAPDEAITATATDPANNTSEFSNCVGPAPVGPGHVTGGGQTLGSTPLRQISFGLFAKSGSGTSAKGVCDVIDHGTGTHVKCLDADTLIVAGTHATIIGPATVNGDPTRYRIDVDDLDEPGIGRDTFKIQTDSGYTAGGVLTAGNVQIHQ